MIIGVDIGGTKTLVASFKNNTIDREDRFVTSPDSEKFLADLMPLIASHAKRQRLEAISVAAPGIIDHHRGTVVRCGNLPWRDIPLRKVLKEAFDCPVFVENDANLAGLAEAHAMHPLPQSCLFLTVSTGIGSGIIINGRILPALSGSEAGHMMLRRSDGSHRQWQQYASGKALYERTGHMAYELESGRAWHEEASRVADGLLALIPTLQPSVVVIGGSIGAQLDIRWREPLEQILRDKMPHYIDIPPILQAGQPKDAVLYGCNIYAKEHLSA